MLVAADGVPNGAAGFDNKPLVGPKTDDCAPKVDDSPAKLVKADDEPNGADAAAAPNEDPRSESMSSSSIISGGSSSATSERADPVKILLVVVESVAATTGTTTCVDDEDDESVSAGTVAVTGTTITTKSTEGLYTASVQLTTTDDKNRQ